MLLRTILLLAAILTLVSTSLVAKSQVIKTNCLAVDYAHIVKSIEEGKYRFSNTVDEEGMVTFSYDVNEPFTTYLAYARQLITQKNPRAQQHCPIKNAVSQLLAQQGSLLDGEKVVDFIAPFELKQKNNDKAVLLIHGLTDSPYVFHDLAAFYHQQGFTVRTLLLPGHATAPADLIDVELSQWRQAANYAITRTLKDFEHVYLGGFSTGGALILDHLMNSEEPNDKIKGLFLWSPASKAKSDIAWLAQYVDLIPFLDWVGKGADSDFAKYESFPFNAGAQVHDLMTDVYNENVDLPINIKNIPMFVIVSEHDQTINTEATLGLVSQWHHSSKQKGIGSDTVIYYGNADKANQRLPKGVNIIVPVCKETELCAKVHDVAHTSVTNAPTNMHYGVDGQYRNCSHYVGDMNLYQQCKTSEQVIVGEKTAQNLALGKPLHRLTYNPYYQQMLNEIKVFLQKTDIAVIE